jgi:hypothetical protein
MSVIIQGDQLRTILLGEKVVKLAQTPPASGASATLFTIAGGTVLVTSLVGRVKTALSGTTGTFSLGTKPTVGTEEKTGISTAVVVGAAEAGTKLTVLASSGLGGALVVSALVAGNSPFLANPFLVDAGTIELTVGVATMTGSVDWSLSYIPYDDGASVS